MLFNSFDFGFFLIIVFVIYWAIGSKRRTTQNFLLLAGSYVFYGLWDWRFLFLLIASSLIDFYAGMYLAKSQSNSIRKRILYLSLFWNLGILVTFKYFNFFIDSFTNLFGMEAEGFHIWSIIIPVGLSFYTFQTIGYTIDVYKRRIQPTTNIIEFLGFVSFFPQLVAGPIERAKNLLPQFEKEREFSYDSIKDGLRQILWGLFKKIIVADKLGLAVNTVFDTPQDYSSLTMAFVAVLFYFQIYCDFSGYTDIAIGTARLFGFKLSRNFNLPYLARNLTEFWQRWHITLTRWFTDYVYIPFVKSRKKATSSARFVGLLLTMGLVGLWHGANWTFIVFGLFHGVILALERFMKKRSSAGRTFLKGTSLTLNIAYFFFLSITSTILFRAPNIEQAWYMLKQIATFQTEGILSTIIGFKLIYLLFLLIVEVGNKTKNHPLEHFEQYLPRPLRWTVYYILIFIIIRYAEPKEAFIYFQF